MYQEGLEDPFMQRDKGFGNSQALVRSDQSVKEGSTSLHPVIRLKIKERSRRAFSTMHAISNTLLRAGLNESSKSGQSHDKKHQRAHVNRATMDSGYIPAGGTKKAWTL